MNDQPLGDPLMDGERGRQPSIQEDGPVSPEPPSLISRTSSSLLEGMREINSLTNLVPVPPVDLPTLPVLPEANLIVVTFLCPICLGNPLFHIFIHIIYIYLYIRTYIQKTRIYHRGILTLLAQRM